MRRPLGPLGAGMADLHAWREVTLLTTRSEWNVKHSLDPGLIRSIGNQMC